MSTGLGGSQCQGAGFPTKRSWSEVAEGVEETNEERWSGEEKEWINICIVLHHIYVYFVHALYLRKLSNSPDSFHSVIFNIVFKFFATFPRLTLQRASSRMHNSQEKTHFENKWNLSQITGMGSSHLWLDSGGGDSIQGSNESLSARPYQVDSPSVLFAILKNL